MGLLKRIIAVTTLPITLTWCGAVMVAGNVGTCLVLIPCGGLYIAGNYIITGKCVNFDKQMLVYFNLQNQIALEPMLYLFEKRYIKATGVI